MGRKYTLDEVRSIVLSHGAKLLSDEYQGNASKLKIACSCGEIFDKSLANFVLYPKCNKCYMRKQVLERTFTYQEVFDYFKDQGCLLLEETYSHSQIPLRYRCQCGRESKIIYNSFRYGRRCKECGKKKMWENRRPKLEDLKKEFEEQGCHLLAGVYVNANTKMSYICKCGNQSVINLRCFREGVRCKMCCGRPTITLEFLQEYFRSQGCELLATEYKNNATKMPYRCVCGNVAMTNWGLFKNGHRCQVCKINKLSGPNSCKWKPDKTRDERVRQRLIDGYKEWRTAIFERDNYTCQKCHNRGRRLNAHHYYSYVDNPELRIDLDNGITLCLECHNSFHGIYGKANNTKAQFDEFLITATEYTS